MPTSADRNRYIVLFIVTVLAAPFVAELRGEISADATHLLYGILIGLAVVFLAAAARKNRTMNS